MTESNLPFYWAQFDIELENKKLKDAGVENVILSKVTINLQEVVAYYPTFDDTVTDGETEFNATGVFMRSGDYFALKCDTKTFHREMIKAKTIGRISKPSETENE